MVTVTRKFNLFMSCFYPVSKMFHYTYNKHTFSLSVMFFCYFSAVVCLMCSLFVFSLLSFSLLSSQLAFFIYFICSSYTYGLCDRLCTTNFIHFYYVRCTFRCHLHHFSVVCLQKNSFETYTLHKIYTKRRQSEIVKKNG